MNYVEWAEEYYCNARRIHSVLEKKKQQLKAKKSMTADSRKQLTDEIGEYRRIFHELVHIGDTLLSRAEGAVREA